MASKRVSVTLIFAMLFLLTLVLTSALLTMAESAKETVREPATTSPLKALFITGGVYHDYDKLAPYLTSQLSKLINIQFQVVPDLKPLLSAHFADGYDLIIYDFCVDDVDPVALDHALQVGRDGKPTVFIHCAIHSFRNSPKIHDWEDYVGLRSKFHDSFGPFGAQRVLPSNPITAGFPAGWKTSGDELYQTIEVLPGTEPLITAKSPVDGRVHVVAWFHNYGRARVFATTLGHDSETAESPAYLRLLANGILWACHKLDSDGNPKPGYDAGK